MLNTESYELVRTIQRVVLTVGGIGAAVAAATGIYIGWKVRATQRHSSEVVMEAYELNSPAKIISSKAQADGSSLEGAHPPQSASARVQNVFS